MQLIYVEDKYIKQYESIAKGYNLENTVEEILNGKKVIFKKKADAIYLRNLIKNNGIPKETTRKRRKSRKYRKSKSLETTKSNTNAKQIGKVIIGNDEGITCTQFAKLLIQQGYDLEQGKPNILHTLLNQHGIFRKELNNSLVNEKYIDNGYFIYSKTKNKTINDINFYKILITEKGKEFIIKTLGLRKFQLNDININKKQNDETNSADSTINTAVHILHDQQTIRDYIINELTRNKYDLNCKYNDIFKSLRDKGYFYYDNKKNNIPNNKYINELKYFSTILINNNDRSYYKILISEQGKSFLENYLLENNLIQLKNPSSFAI